MQYDFLVRQLTGKLTSRGWTFGNSNNEKKLFLKNNLLFDEEIEILFPTDLSKIDFPMQLRASLESILNLCPDLKKDLSIRNLAIFSKNIANKYSKSKNKWVLREPNSKYNLNEIPDIYVPKF